METIPQKELRNNIGEVLRRAEAGEELTITVSGRPVAVLGPVVRKAHWVPGSSAWRSSGTRSLTPLWRKISSSWGEIWSIPGLIRG